MKNKVQHKNINFNLYSEDVYCAYGTNNNPLLNDEMSLTIEEAANNYKIKDKLNIQFNTYDDAPIDENEFTQAYKNTFSSKIKSKQHELKRCIITGLILLLVGILTLAFDVFIEELVPYFWFEFFNVFSWVFCWGGIEVLTIELIQIQIEINKAKRLTHAKIVFKHKD